MTEDGWKHVRDERLGMYDCKVWKKFAGSVITYVWREVEHGTKRQTIVVCTRPRRVYMASGKYPDGDYPYVRDRHGRLRLDDFLRVTEIKLGKRCFDFGTSDTVFSGHLLDAKAYEESDGEYAYIAKFWS